MILRVPRLIPICVGAAFALSPMAAVAQLSPVQIVWDGQSLKSPTPAIADRREVYLPFEIVRQLAGWCELTPRKDAFLLSKGSQRVEVAAARPGALPMAPCSLVATVLDLEVTRKGDTCLLTTASYRSRTRPAIPAKQEEPRSPRTQPSRGGALSSPRIAPEVTETDPRQAKSISGSSQSPAGIAEPTGRPLAVGGSASKQIQVAASIDRSNGDKRPSQAPRNPALAPQNAGEVAGGPGKTPAATVQPAQSIENILNVDLTKPHTLPGAAELLRLTGMRFEAMDSSHAQVRWTTTQGVKQSVVFDADHAQLVIDVPGASADLQQPLQEINHPFVQSISAETAPSGNGTRLFVGLRRLVSYQLHSLSPNEHVLNLGLPRGSGQRIQDVVVVVDPGHGADKTGCNWRTAMGCIYEKELTLAISRKLRDSLEAMGCRVVLTRDDDSNPGYKERPGLAVQHNADLFVSVHINDCKRPNTASGSETFFHRQDSSSRALAESILHRMVRAGKMVNRGAKSDLTRFPGTGMAVLRYSSVPASLVEVGFLNHASDRAKMIDPDFQRSIAAAIAEGVRGYVEGKLPTAALETNPGIVGMNER